MFEQNICLSANGVPRRFRRWSSDRQIFSRIWQRSGVFVRSLGMSEARFVFEATGSRGDVAPLLAVAREMRSRGHEATLLGPAAFATESRDSGVEYVVTTERHLHALPGRMVFDHFYFPAFREVVRHFDEAARSGKQTVVINIEKTATSNLLCERDGLPGVRLHLTPFKVRSLVSPPWPYSQGAQGPGRQHHLEQTLPKLFEASDRHQGLLAYINDRRAELGLGPIHSATPKELHLARQACFFPGWFCPPASDWPAGIQMLGFPLPAPSGSLPRIVSDFLRAGEPPLVFTTGTGVSQVDAFFGHARESCRILGKRGVFLSPYITAGPCPDATILPVDYADLPLLLPHCALVVHHGGIGTLARALEAGIPQIITPLRFDQPDNARRIEHNGLGLRLERDVLSGQSLALLATRLLADTAAHERMQRASARVRASRAVQQCAGLLESCVPAAAPVCRDLSAVRALHASR